MSDLKSIKQMAEELGIPKQRVYRYIRANRISEAHQSASVMYYDDAAQAQILQHFEKNERISDAHQSTSDDAVLDVLRSELEAKNQQIADLTAALANVTATLKAAQLLHAGTMNHLEAGSKKGLLARLLGRGRRT